MTMPMMTEQESSHAASDADADGTVRSGESAAETVRDMVRGSIWILLAGIVILPTAFVTSIYLARSLGPAIFGIFAISSRLVFWMELSVFSLFSGATIKFAGEEQDWASVSATASRLYLSFGAILAISLGLSANWLSRLFNEPAMAFHISLFCIEIPIISLAHANLHLLMGRGMFKAQSLASFSYWASRLVLIVIFVEIGWSINGAIFGSIAAAFVQLSVTSVFSKPNLFNARGFPMKRYLRFGLPISVSNLCQRLFRLDLFALKVLGGSSADAGCYAAAINLSMPPTLALSQSIAPPLLSTLSRLLSVGKIEEAQETAATAMRSIFWLLPLAAMVSATSSEIVTFVYGENFKTAATALSLLIFAATGLHIINMGRTVLTAYDRPGRTLWLTLPMIPIALAGHFMVIPAFQMKGAAAVTCAISLLGAFFALVMVYRMWGTPPPLPTMAKSLLACIIAILGSLLWDTQGVELILKLIVISMAVVACFILLRELSKRELAFAWFAITREPHPTSSSGNHRR
jgi:O-antigen/teichoic acid export membrane protein